MDTLASEERYKRSTILEVLRKIMPVKELRHSWSRENDFAHTELADLKLDVDASELLKHMKNDGLLVESNTTTILSCPSCGKSDYVAVLRCTKCGQSAIMKEYLLEHRAAGHVHPESAFRRSEGYVCPSCGKRLTQQEYRVVGFWFVCEKCGEKQPQPKLEFRCLADGTTFTEAAANLKRLSDYRVTEKGMARLEFDKYGLVDTLISIAERSGVKVVKEPSQSGVSGIRHVFDLSLECGDEEVRVDVLYSKDLIDGRDVLASYAKLIDTGVQRYVLVAWPRLSGEAKALLTFYKLNVVEASTVEELERVFTSLLSGLKGGCSSSGGKGRLLFIRRQI